MTYEVTVTREGDTWLADVPDVPGAHTFARSLDGLAKSVREVVILMDDLDDNAEVDLSFTYAVADDLVTAAAQTGRERRALADREAELQAATLAMVRTLTSQGYSVRDTARLLAITPGRVSQLTNA
ncbi:MAG: type II toxin-antitoxin system HicB family antitoxin [Marmoricola sp.]